MRVLINEKRPMRVHYTGVPSGLTPTMQKQIQARLTRIGKILDKKGEKEGHVILKDAGRSRQAEITVNHHHHAFAGKATAKDDFGALAAAIDKLEKQIIKQEGKWRLLFCYNKPSLASHTPPNFSFPNSEHSGPNEYTALPN